MESFYKGVSLFLQHAHVLHSIIPHPSERPTLHAVQKSALLGYRTGCARAAARGSGRFRYDSAGAGRVQQHAHGPVSG